MRYPHWFALTVCCLSGLIVVSFLGITVKMTKQHTKNELLAQQLGYEQRIHEIKMDYALERSNLEMHYADLICDLQIKNEASVIKVAELEGFIENLDLESKSVVLTVTRTAYTASVDETDSTPHITATGTKPKAGRTIAVSRDLFKHLKHRQVVIDGNVYTIEDTMNERYTNRIDLFVNSKTEARKIGVGKIKVVLLPDTKA